MTNLKKYRVFSTKQVWYAAFLLVFVFLLAIFFLGKAEKSGAAWYDLTGLSPGFQGASCPGAAADWVAVRGDLRDAPTGNQINGTFTAACQYSYTSGGLYHEGPDPVHPLWTRFGSKCAGGSAGLMGVVCMGSCVLPFNLNADAVNYSGTPTWLVNHGVGETTGTLYPEGNANTANYNIYLDRQACETCSWNDCSGLNPVCKDPWGNVCNTGAACAGNSFYCSNGHAQDGDRMSRNQGCRAGGCYDDSDTMVEDCPADSTTRSCVGDTERITTVDQWCSEGIPQTSCDSIASNSDTLCGPDRCDGENWVDYWCTESGGGAHCDSLGSPDCGGWADAGCGLGGCSLGQMQQTRNCTHDCGAESRCVASFACGGVILGRVWVDADADKVYDTGERLAQNGVSCGTPLSFTLGGVTVSYSGPSSGSRNPDACNPDPYYSTGLLSAGSYSVRVNPPEGWFATTPLQTANLIGGNLAHLWFGIIQGPIAEASIAKTTAGPWSDTVLITNAEPDVDISKDPNFVLSALKDITGDGLASRDPKGGPITCTWAYDTDNAAATTFTGCQLGAGAYTLAKKQEMVDYYKAKPPGRYVAQLTVTDSKGFADTDVVGIVKELPPPFPIINVFDIDPQCDAGTAQNIIAWDVSNTSSYELKGCEGATCTPATITSGAFTGNPTSFTHKPLKDAALYKYQLVVHGPGGDKTSPIELVNSKNCKGEIRLVVWLTDDQGERFFPLPGARVKLMNTAGISVIATTTTDADGWAIFDKLIPGTYGALSYKDKFIGGAKQAGDCSADVFTTTNATIGPNAITESHIAAWDNNIPVKADEITFCHDLSLEGIPPLMVECNASPGIAEIGKTVTWEAQVSGGESSYTYSWTGSNGLTGSSQSVTKTYATEGIKSATITVKSGAETASNVCVVQIINAQTCDENLYPQNQLYACHYDYDFDSSPDSDSIRNGNFLKSSANDVIPVAQQGKMKSALGINENWGTGVIEFTEKTDHVGSIWQGQMNFEPNSYKFFVESDDGIQLFVNGSLVLDKWTKGGGNFETGFIPLSGSTRVKLYWFDDTGNAKIKLRWVDLSCDMSNRTNKFTACFYKGVSPGSGEYLGGRTDATISAPAPRTAIPIDHNYFFGGEYGEVDNFSGLWRGIINFSPGFYKFRVEANDGVRLDIEEDGTYEINDWTDGGKTRETGFIVVGGDTPMRLEWYEKQAEAEISLSWIPSVTLDGFKRLFASLLSLVML